MTVIHTLFMTTTKATESHACAGCGKAVRPVLRIFCLPCQRAIVAAAGLTKGSN